jgi:hypothetical protein
MHFIFLFSFSFLFYVPFGYSIKCSWYYQENNKYIISWHSIHGYIIDPFTFAAAQSAARAAGLCK